MSSVRYSPHSNSEYTVGWICALPVEMAAAKGMMDEEHGEPQTPPQETDKNTYLLGRVGKFNVVVACLPKDEIGSSSAAAVAKDMLFTFQGVRVGLLVGIGAGIPDYENDDIQDIRLGDVVISSDKENGGVVLYDFGKKLLDGSFQSVYALDRPPRSLRTAISRLEAEHETRENKIPQYINEMLEKFPFMRKKRYTYPGRSADKLFQADYHHVSGRSCAKCDPTKQSLLRPQNRPNDDPVIHYGVIATGSTVVKQAPTREEIRRKHRAVCLEMEAAGLMNNFPCVVIRGISDYADSHKNDQWQPYAAAAAAACAKELLEYVQIKALDAERTAKDIASQVDEIRADMAKVTAKINAQKELDILEWISTLDYAPQHNDFIKRRQPGTGQWFLDSTEFQEWLKTDKQTLFCPGIPGAGKTIITAIVIDHLKKLFKDDANICIAYIYCNFQRQDEQKVENLLANLLKQLAQGHSSLPNCVADLHERYEKDRMRPSFDEILNTLHSVAATYSRIFIIVDALDECQIFDGSRTRFLKEIFKLQSNSITNIFATSRPNDEISRVFNGGLSRVISAADGDILEYLNAQISIRESDIIDNDTRDTIKAAVIEATSGMFLLAALHVDTIINQPTKGHIKEALQELGRGTKGLNLIYEQAMERINSHINADIAKQTLMWIINAKRPLSTTEIQHALAIRPHCTALNADYLPSVKLLQSLCAGLVTIDEESRIIRLVHYTVKEYFDETRRKWFPTAESDITTVCAVYLSFDIFETGFCSTNKEFEERLRANPFYSYASQHWGHHARECSKLNAEVGSFLRSTAKVEASSQAMFASHSDWRYDIRWEPRNINGLHLAAYFGLGREISDLLSERCFTDMVDLADSYCRTPLSLAAENGHDAVIKLLLQTGKVVVNSIDNQMGQTPLSLAAKNGHINVVKQLLGTGEADINFKDDGGQTPLSLAAEHGHAAVVKLLLETGKADVDWKYTKLAQSPLSLAAENGHDPVVKLLLETAKVDVNWWDWRVMTPLSLAAKNGYDAVVKLLLETGKVDVNQRHWYIFKKPLSLAAEHGHTTVVKLLLEMGKADVNVKDENGQTPLSLAAENGHDTVVKLLLETGKADVDLEDEYGRTPLSLAAENGQDTVVKLLLETDKADVDLEDKYGRTPLWLAADNGHGAVVKLLLGRGVASISTRRIPIVGRHYSGRREWMQRNGEAIA